MLSSFSSSFSFGRRGNPLLPAGIVTSGLQFNLETAPISGTTWTDSSGNGRNATLLGSPSYVSNNGGGIRLNNEDLNGTDYISVPYNIASNTVTIEVVASFNPTSFWGAIWGNEIYDTSGGYLAYVSSSTEIFLEKHRDKTIGITGTKGKSTTSSLIALLLKNAGYKVELVGNIGLPAIDKYYSEVDYFVYELSSFQLDDLKVSPHIAVFLNIFEEHLDYHKSFENYLNAKAKIFLNQKINFL